jgi:tetratricopeptide (TPR) repeat protein
MPLGGIAGQIRPTSGELPSRPILVELRLHGATLNSTYADTRGYFSFSGLDPNEYHLVINDEAYSPVDQVAPVSPENLNSVSVIVLRPAEVRNSNDPLRGRASGSNPYLVNLADYNKTFPKAALKEYKRGLDAEHNGQLDQAMARYQNALKIAPDYYPAHNNLGSLFLSKRDFNLAEEQFRAAIQLRPNDADAYFNLGNVLMLTHRYPESDNVISAGLQRSPNVAFGHFLKGCLLEGEKDLRQALALDTMMWQAHLQLVDLYLQQGRRDDAIGELRVFLKGFSTVSAAPKARDLLSRLESSTAKR